MHGWCKVRNIRTWLVQGINSVKWLVQGKKLCDMAVKRFLQLSFRIFLFTRNTVESGQYEHSITIQLQYTAKQRLTKMADQSYDSTGSICILSKSAHAVAYVRLHPRRLVGMSWYSSTYSFVKQIRKHSILLYHNTYYHVESFPQLMQGMNLCNMAGAR